MVFPSSAVSPPVSPFAIFPANQLHMVRVARPSAKPFSPIPKRNRLLSESAFRLQYRTNVLVCQTFVLFSQKFPFSVSRPLVQHCYGCAGGPPFLPPFHPMAAWPDRLLTTYADGKHSLFLWQKYPFSLYPCSPNPNKFGMKKPASFGVRKAPSEYRSFIRFFKGSLAAALRHPK